MGMTLTDRKHWRDELVSTVLDVADGDGPLDRLGALRLSHGALRDLAREWAGEAAAAGATEGAIAAALDIDVDQVVNLLADQDLPRCSMPGCPRLRYMTVEDSEGNRVVVCQRHGNHALQTIRGARRVA